MGNAPNYDRIVDNSWLPVDFDDILNTKTYPNQLLNTDGTNYASFDPLIHNAKYPNGNILVPSGVNVSLPTSPGLSFTTPAFAPFEQIMVGFRSSIQVVNNIVIEGTLYESTGGAGRVNGGSNATGSLDNELNVYTNVGSSNIWINFETFWFIDYDGTAKTYEFRMRHTGGSAANYGYNYHFWARFIS